MSSAEKLEFVSIEDYLVSEETARTRNEYIDGWVRAMSGATNRHNKVAENCFLTIALALKGKPCQPHIFDTKLRIVNQQTKRFYYPDLQVVCESNLPTETYQDRPVLIVEVLSPSTRLYDLDEKLTAYTQIPTLQYYLILEQHQPIAILIKRNGELFERLEFNGLELSIGLPFLQLSLAMRNIYDGVSFTPTCVQEPDPQYQELDSARGCH
jgi:Uma2 family endonuclease